ncbi:MAG: AAA family ATPase, partial [Planctomycetaceae bacterium]|nr:AAA family ATPase [Planctomycetaceae bacterium]
MIINENKNTKILPYSNSNFQDIILNNYIYVDKTRYIELLEKEANRNQLFIRPRKFGKSLFLHTLMSYY